MKDVVLGGDGLIGSVLCGLLRERGHRVASLDLRSGSDLRQLQAESLQGFDRVWFLAWDVGGAKYLAAAEAQHACFKANCELAARVFDALALTHTPFLFVTSQLAGQPHAYGLTKRVAEQWTRTLGGKLARLWNVYGWERPDLRSHFVPDLVLAGLRDGAVRCQTDGRERRRLLYKSDCAEALLALFEGPQGEADIAGADWLTVGDVAREIGRQLEVPVRLGEAAGSEAMVEPRVWPEGWRPRVSLDAGVAAVIRDARVHLARE